MTLDQHRIYSATELLADLTPDDLAILERRSQELAKVDVAEQVEELVNLLTFFIGNEVYGVPVEAIREVRPVRHRTRVPCAPTFVAGVMNLRGTILSLVNLHQFLGIAVENVATLGMVMVVETNELEVGILAEKVGEVITLPLSDFKPAPANINSLAAKYVSGVSGSGIILLNLSAVFSDPTLIVNLEHN